MRSFRRWPAASWLTWGLLVSLLYFGQCFCPPLPGGGHRAGSVLLAADHCSSGSDEGQGPASHDAGDHCCWGHCHPLAGNLPPIVFLFPLPLFPGDSFPPRRGGLWRRWRRGQGIQPRAPPRFRCDFS